MKWGPGGVVGNKYKSLDSNAGRAEQREEFNVTQARKPKFEIKWGRYS